MLYEIDDDALRAMTAQQQREEVETWFRSRYEDPAERTPYESAEGGYIWIWGGPYSADEEVRGRFEGVVPDEVLAEIVEDLEHECFNWAPTPREGDYDESLWSAISSNQHALLTFDTGLHTIARLMTQQVEDDLQDAYHRLHTRT